MSKDEILTLWQSGLSKHKVADMYRTNYNNGIKIIRLNPKGRNAGFISKFDALNKVEKIIYNYLRRKQ